RHTRFDCDWSSDVCSSDLEELLIAAGLGVLVAADFKHRAREEVMFGTITRAGELRPLLRRFVAETLAGAAQGLDLDHAPAVVLRSEERRVGKERMARVSLR